MNIYIGTLPQREKVFRLYLHTSTEVLIEMCTANNNNNMHVYHPLEKEKNDSSGNFGHIVLLIVVVFYMRSLTTERSIFNF